MSDEVPVKTQAMGVEKNTPEEPTPMSLTDIFEPICTWQPDEPGTSSLNDIFEPICTWQPDEPGTSSVRDVLEPGSTLPEVQTPDSERANSLISDAGDETETPYENMDDSSDPGYANGLESPDTDECVLNLAFAHNQAFTKFFKCKKKSASESGVVSMQHQRRDAGMEAPNKVKIMAPNHKNVGVVSSCSSSFPRYDEVSSEAMSQNDAPRSYYSTPLPLPPPSPQPGEYNDVVLGSGSSYSLLNDAIVPGVVKEVVTQDNHTSCDQQLRYSQQWVGRGPLHTVCPSCNEVILTVVRRYNNLQTDDNCSFNACCFCFWPCFFLPYWIPSMQDVEHSCPHCNAYLGTFRRA